MDRPFIQKMCESYYSDFALGKTHIWENQPEAVSELSNEIFKIMENLKLEDIELYQDLFEFNRQKQYRIVYSLLGEYMNESFSDEVLPEEITESALAAGVLGAGLVGFAAGFKPISKVTCSAISKFGDTVDNIAKSISKFTTKFKIHKAIMFSDQDDCYRSCGMRDEKDLTRLTVLRGMTRIGIGSKSEQQIKCLTLCFFKTAIDLASSLANQYSQCISQSGKSSPIGLADILGQPPVRTCKPIHSKLMELRSEFDNAIGLIYDRENKRKLIEQFDNAISTGLRGKTSFTKRPNQKPKKRF